MASNEGEQAPNINAKGSQKKRRNRKKDDDWEDDVANDLAELTLEVNKGVADEEEEEDDVPKPAKKVKEKKKKKNRKDEDDEDEENNEVTSTGGKSRPQPSFQMLMMDDEDENDDNKSDEEDGNENIVLESVKETALSKSQKKDKKSKKKEKEKSKTAEEEDIDAILASLNEPAAKKKGKKGKKEESKEMSPEADAAAEDGDSATKEEPKVVTMEDLEAEAEAEEKKKKKKKSSKVEDGEDKGEEEDGEEDGEHTVKTAAQKRKEKREREKLKKQKEKQKSKKKGDDEDATGESQKTEEAAAEAEGGQEKEGEEGQEEDGEKTGKKKKKKGEKKKDEKEKPKRKQIEAIKEQLRKIQEEKERVEKEEEERRRQEEEAIRLHEEKKRLEEEKRLKKKEKERLRKERLKQEGKLLTEKQKQDQRRFNQMLELMKERGIEVPSRDEEVKKKRPVYIDKKKKKNVQATEEKTPSPTEEQAMPPLTVEEEPVKATPESPVEDESSGLKESWEEVSADDVKEAWDASSDEEAEEEKGKKAAAAAEEVEEEDEEEEEEEDESDEEEDEDEEESEEEESSEESSEDEDLTPIERARERIMKRHEEAEKLKTTDVLRAPVVCVLGHVDTGKTKILDKLRRTHVQDGEAGGITQQIGATNVPKSAIMEQTKMCKEFQKMEMRLPGLLIIDTPGHESFSNLRTRGSSLCDIAILVIDIMHGLEPQTIESINLLKERKTPFVVALNKIDRLYQWKTNPTNDVQNTIKKQSPHTKHEFDERAQQVIVQLAEEGLNAALFYENKNPKEYISLVPTSAHSADGMGNLIALICELSQNMLAKRIAYSQELQATVMEVKALPGLGTTIDVILVNGKLNEGATIVLAGTDGPIVTQVRGLLMPQPMKELRVKSQYEHCKEVIAAQGVKIIAKDLEKSLAGLPLHVAYNQDEADYYRQEVAESLSDVLESIKLSERGVFVQASTLGSLEALLEFLRTSKIPYAGINIGPVHKKDIMKASIMLEHDSQYAVILAFDVKVEREAQELADSLGVKIFMADIIYHLFDKFMAYREELKQKRQEEFKHLAVFPCKVRVMPQFVFNSRDPIVVGVTVEAGTIREGTPLCVPSKEFLDIGRVVSVENNHKPVEMAKQGQEVCIKIEAIPGEAPKMFGRHFDHTDALVSKISRQTIDVMKEYFRDEMQKSDWVLVMELKKMFQII